MCGIAGIIHKDPAAPVEESLLKRMCDTIVHRGPDGDVPLVRIEGVALMGGVSVRVKERKKPKRAK